MSFSIESKKCGKRQFWKRFHHVRGPCPFPAICVQHRLGGIQLLQEMRCSFALKVDDFQRGTLRYLTLLLNEKRTKKG